MHGSKVRPFCEKTRGDREKRQETKVVKNLILDHENFKFKENRFHTTTQKTECGPYKKH